MENDVPIELTEEFNGQPIVCVGSRIPGRGFSQSDCEDFSRVHDGGNKDVRDSFGRESRHCIKEDTNTNGKSDRRDAQAQGRRRKWFDVNALC